MRVADEEDEESGGFGSGERSATRGAFCGEDGRVCGGEERGHPSCAMFASRRGFTVASLFPGTSGSSVHPPCVSAREKLVHWLRSKRCGSRRLWWLVVRAGMVSRRSLLRPRLLSEHEG